ncbi:MAG: hypothetical protein WDO24_05705 [Pseudomonadota bacterium]
MTKPKIACIQALAGAMMRDFLCKDESRYYLAGFLIEPDPEAGGVIVVATDGAKMLTVHDPLGRADGPMIVKVAPKLLKQKPQVGPNWLVVRQWEDGSSRADVVSCSRTKDRHDDPVALTERSTANIVGTQHMAVIDATFPEWRRTMPTRNTNRGGTSFIGFHQLKAFDLPYTADETGLFKVDRAPGAGSFMLKLADEMPGAPVLVDLGSKLGRYVYGCITLELPGTASKTPGYINRVFTAIAGNVTKLKLKPEPKTAARLPVEVPAKKAA